MGRLAAAPRPRTTRLRSLNAMKIAVFGAGAIGLYVAARLGAAGQSVSVVLRPGVELPLPLWIEEDGRIDACTGLVAAHAGDAAPQDLLIVAVKAHQLPAALPALLPWIGPATELVLTQNGLPWWYFQGSGKYAGRILEASDPGGTLARGIDPHRVIACVVRKAAERTAPDRIAASYAAGDGFVLGRPLGGSDRALDVVAALFDAANLQAEISSDIRGAVWEKLVGNAALNPVSAITGADLGTMLADASLRTLLLAAMTEVQAVASAFGIALATSPAQRLERSAQVAAGRVVRTSMLQDRLAGRTLELAPIVGAVAEAAALAGVAVPRLATLYACTAALQPLSSSTRKTS